jgi:hypothetical protein
MLEMEFNNGYVVKCFAKANRLLLLLNFTKHAPVSLFLLFLIRKGIRNPGTSGYYCVVWLYLWFFLKNPYLNGTCPIDPQLLVISDLISLQLIKKLSHDLWQFWILLNICFPSVFQNSFFAGKHAFEANSYLFQWQLWEHLDKRSGL